MPVSSLGNHRSLRVQQLPVPIPLDGAGGGRVDDADDLHLVPVPAVDERLLLLDLGFVLDLQVNLENCQDH